MISCFQSPRFDEAFNTDIGAMVLDLLALRDPIDAMKRYFAKRKYKNKLYTHFKPQYVGKQRAFSKSNSGMLFEAAWLIDINSIPVLAFFYSDASFSGQHTTHHPIYSKQSITAINLIIFNYFHYFRCVCSICTKTSAPNQVPGFLLGGSLYTMKPETRDLAGVMILQVHVKCDCSMSAVLNFWTNGKKNAKMLSLCLGQTVFSA